MEGLTLKLIGASAFISVGGGLAPVLPPKAKPVIIGTSDYSNILFGKVQRAASLYGPNLRQPFTILSKGDSQQKLDNCLWTKFCMANSGSAGIEEENDILRPLTGWIPQGNLKDCIIFADAASPSNPSGNSLVNSFSFQRKRNNPANDLRSEIRELSTELLKVAVERECAHVYVLSNDASLSACIATLQETCVAHGTPCTILVLEANTILEATSGWTSSRSQDMRGELSIPIELRLYCNETNPAPQNQTRTFPAEDAAEVMLQLSLRASRSPESLLRIVRLGIGGELEGRANADYFTLVGGKKARARAGSVLSVASWDMVLSPSFGPVIASLGQELNTPSTG